ncbi:protein ANTAGONIST OF LIKE HETEROCHROMATIN PROTEIN 1-like, partial [Camponotus floridanus]|uniref:protein ANTAGONIST OF LIKE HETEROCHROMATIN PROTEIN 1-like n=1 Tax=Camponotus floridanus TaxID=104421 RepID=UPI000DC67EF6
MPQIIKYNKRKRLFILACVGNIFIFELYLYLKRLKKFSGRRWWVHPLILERGQLGAYETVFLRYKHTDHEKFFRFTRLTVEQFEELLTIITDDIQKHSYREFLTPEFRLAITLSYLASGNSIVSLSNYWKIGKSTAYEVIRETCEAIWKCLKSTHLAPPSTIEWKRIADGYWSRWNLPNCCGALDGKHIRLQCPPKCGFQFFNYKQYFSFVLMALCDSKYCFTWMEVGNYGSLPDSSIFSSSAFGIAMEEGSLNFPDPERLPGSNVFVPYFLVGDEAFPLRTNLMRPYP